VLHNDPRSHYQPIFIAGKFLVDNYHQALEILEGEAALLALTRQHGVTDTSVFKDWLVEEKKYLEGLLAEPPEETLEMDYYEARVRLDGFE
jgi:hypothetical protein